MDFVEEETYTSNRKPKDPSLPPKSKIRPIKSNFNKVGSHIHRRLVNPITHVGQTLKRLLKFIE